MFAPILFYSLDNQTPVPIQLYHHFTLDSEFGSPSTYSNHGSISY